ncbi:MAG: methylglyoxal synthase [Desulforegulaceae bacterium]|jgi:methylglyoxal synthase|nr:methylglyoxal synthase [Desulforegulaceae bacterium]
MEYKEAVFPDKKRIALIAHDGKKDEMISWVKSNKKILIEHELYATGTTGSIIENELGIKIKRMQSGPLGGDLQIGALISEKKIDILVFFWDPLEAQPHEPDIRALLRLAVLWNIPAATNMASADFIFSSPLFKANYKRLIPDYETYQKQREIKIEQCIKACIISD